MEFDEFGTSRPFVSIRQVPAVQDLTSFFFSLFFSFGLRVVGNDAAAVADGWRIVEEPQ